VLAEAARHSIAWTPYDLRGRALAVASLAALILLAPSFRRLRAADADAVCAALARASARGPRLTG
jgi:hypothetical protein